MAILTYEELYRERCRQHTEAPDHAEMYRDLDRVRAQIEASPDRAVLRQALSGSRATIAVPYTAWLAGGGDSRFPPDGAGLIHTSPGFDGYRSRVADMLDNTYNMYTHDVFRAWVNAPAEASADALMTNHKLALLGRYVDQDWDSYVEAYLSA